MFPLTVSLLSDFMHVNCVNMCESHLEVEGQWWQKMHHCLRTLEFIFYSLIYVDIRKTTCNVSN